MGKPQIKEKNAIVKVLRMVGQNMGLLKYCSKYFLPALCRLESLPEYTPFLYDQQIIRNHSGETQKNVSFSVENETFSRNLKQ